MIFEFESSPISDSRLDPEGALLGFEARVLDPRMKTRDAELDLRVGTLVGPPNYSQIGHSKFDQTPYLN